MAIFIKAVGMLCLLLTLSAAAMVAASALNAPQPAWFLMMFELVILLACVWGARAALRPGDGGIMATTLVCVSLCVLVGSVLGRADGWPVGCLVGAAVGWLEGLLVG